MKKYIIYIIKYEIINLYNIFKININIHLTSSFFFSKIYWNEWWLEEIWKINSKKDLLNIRFKRQFNDGNSLIVKIKIGKKLINQTNKSLLFSFI